MSDYDIHSCGYFCDRPACILRQRDELRDKLFEGLAVKTYSGGKPNYTQPIEQEPVAWWHDRGDVVDLNVSGHGTPLYFASPKKEWVGLTDEEVGMLTVFDGLYHVETPLLAGFARSIEAKLKEKNNGI